MIIHPCPQCGKTPRIKIRYKSQHIICTYKCCKFKAQGISVWEHIAVTDAGTLWNRRAMDAIRERSKENESVY